MITHFTITGTDLEEVSAEGHRFLAGFDRPYTLTVSRAMVPCAPYFRDDLNEHFEGWSLTVEAPPEPKSADDPAVKFHKDGWSAQRDCGIDD